MSHILAIVKKELRSYFNSPIAYIFITAFLVLTGWLFFRTFFLAGQASMREYFSLMPWIFLFIVPAVTMRMWAEEKKSGTIEVFLTWPIKEWEAVAGKFLASFAFLAITILLSFPIVITVFYLGKPDAGAIIGSYLGVLFLGAAYLAIGLWVSSFTKNQIVAFISALAISFALFIVGENAFLFAMPESLAGFFRYLGLGSHFGSISRGVLDSRDFVYYLSVIGFFLFLNVRAVESRKWK